MTNEENGLASLMTTISSTMAASGCEQIPLLFKDKNTGKSYTLL